jgi:hypothetical protein
MREKILEINEVTNIKLGNRPFATERANLGMIQILNALLGCSSYDGYEVVTTGHRYLILIDNGQCCCESWGYLISEDDYKKYIGKELLSVELTDTALNNTVVENSDYYEGSGSGIQFVDFKMTDGSVLQFAVYNDHNGYYGHPIIIAKDDDIILQDTL